MKGIFDGPFARIALAVFAVIWLAIETRQGNVLWMVVAGLLVALALADVLLRNRSE